MPKIETTQGVDQLKPYGVAPSDNQKNFQERLMERFLPHEWVTVKNVDDEPYIWQYMPAENEDFEFTPDPMKITRRGEPEMWVLDPGQSETIVGANAYLMIEGLYKKLLAKKVLSKSPAVPGQAQNFNYADGGQQDEWINRIYKGKATPQFNVPVAEEDKNDQATVEAAKRTVGATSSSK